jgi:membrane protein
VNQQFPDHLGRSDSRASHNRILARWWRILLRVYRGIEDDRILATAAGVSFYILLAIFPGLAGLISLYGLFADGSTVSQHLDLLSGFLPQGGLEIIRDQLEKLTSQPAPKLGLATMAGFAFSLWSANGGVKALFDALNIAYDKRERRGFVALNLISIALTLGATGFMILSLLVITVAPEALEWIGWAHAGAVFGKVRWPILLLIASLGIAIIYRCGPSRERPRWRWISPGNAFATLAWIAASVLFSWYTQHFGSYDKTYGSLGAAVGFMTWLWISTIVVLVGARLDAELERETPARR